ncbi:MAG: hypothetical protein ACQEQO_04795 [Thermodesulfobacteriota bacterium]
MVFSAPFSPSGRLYEPEAASHFKKVHHLSYDDKNCQVLQRSPSLTEQGVPEEIKHPIKKYFLSFVSTLMKTDRISSDAQRVTIDF